MSQKYSDAPHKISKAQHLINDYISLKLSSMGLSDIVPSHGDILYTLFMQDEISLKKLARTIHRDPSTVTSLIRKLEDFGYVNILRSSEDRRYRVVKLTDKGRNLEVSMNQLSEEMLDILWRDIHPDEQTAFLNTLNVIIMNFEAEKKN